MESEHASVNPLQKLTMRILREGQYSARIAIESSSIWSQLRISNVFNFETLLLLC